MAIYSKTRELTVGPSGTALSVYHLTAHQNIDSEIQAISDSFGSLKDIEVKTAMYKQSADGTDTLTSNQIIYHGWDFLNGNGTASQTLSITLPNGGYDDNTYDAFASYIGSKAGSDPTTRADTTTVYSDAIARPDSQTNYSATQLGIRLSVTGTTFASGTRQIFTWMTIGTKA